MTSDERLASIEDQATKLVSLLQDENAKGMLAWNLFLVERAQELTRLLKPWCEYGTPAQVESFAYGNLAVDKPETKRSTVRAVQSGGTGYISLEECRKIAEKRPKLTFRQVLLTACNPDVADDIQFREPDDIHNMRINLSCALGHIERLLKKLGNLGLQTNYEWISGMQFLKFARAQEEIEAASHE